MRSAGWSARRRAVCRGVHAPKVVLSLTVRRSHEGSRHGHHGYIGSVLVPDPRDAGHDVVGLDTCFYGGCDFGSAARARSARSTPTSVTSPPRTSRASTRSSTSRRSRTTRSAISTRLDVRHQSRRRRSRSRARRRRQASGGSSSPRPARCTARRDDELLGGRTAAAADAVRGVEGAGGGGAGRARRTTTSRGLDAERDRLRRLAAAAARHRPQQPRGWAHTTGAIRLQSDGIVLAAARPHPRHREGDASRLLEAPRSSSAARPSTSAPTSRTTGSESSPRSCASGAGVRDHVRGGRLAAIHAAIGSTSRSSRSRFLRFASTGTPGRAHTSCSTPIGRRRSTVRISTVTASSGCGVSAISSMPAKLDGQLRRN